MSSSSPTPNPKPAIQQHTAPLDILLLVLDTQRVDRLSCYGYPLKTSPNLDRFAQQATVFKTAIAPAQWTIPSHASMFTGLYPSEHGVQQSYQVLPDSIPTLAERLQAGGYMTAGFCNNPLVGIVNNGLRRGFYSFLNYSGLLTDRPNQAGAHPGWIGRYRQFFKRLLAGVLRRIQDAFARSEFLLALSFTPLMVPLWQTALSFKGNTAKSLGDAARLLIDRKSVAADQPIFTFINLMGTHMPYHPPRHYVQTFAPHVLQDRSARHYLRNFNSDIYGWLAPLAGELDDYQKSILDGMYDAEVAWQDEQLGLFFQQLEASGRLDRTLIIICSDHGEHLGEKQLMGHSLSIYNELIQVPLMIRDPRNVFPQGVASEAIVSTRCLFQTILSAAGLADEREQQFALETQIGSASKPEPIFAEAVPPQNVVNLLKKRQPNLIHDRACDQPRRAVWAGNHKLIETGSDTIELYDIFNDPQENLNLCDILPENVDVLQDCLMTFTQQTSTVTTTLDRASHFDDPEVQRRLRDLGYLED